MTDRSFRSAHRITMFEEPIWVMLSEMIHINFQSLRRPLGIASGGLAAPPVESACDGLAAGGSWAHQGA